MINYSLMLIFSFFTFITDAGTNETSTQEVQNVVSFGKIWGFLKYYHPDVTSGTFDWDDQFLRNYESFKSAKNKAEFNDLLEGWLVSLGTIRGCKTRAPKADYFDKNFDLSWIDDTEIFEPSTTELLREIEVHRGKKQHYVDRGIHWEAQALNEKMHTNFPYVSEAQRVLGMFTYWNIIEYFFPYKYLTDQSWGDVALELTPKFIASTKASEFHVSMLQLVAKIDDSHGWYYNSFTQAFFGNYWIASSYSIAENQVILSGDFNDSLAKIDDLQVGDIVTHVNGIDVQSIRNEKKNYIPSSNSGRDHMGYSFFNGNSELVEITFLRDGISSTKTIHRYVFDDFHFLPYKINDDVCHRSKLPSDKGSTLNSEIGYIKLYAVKSEQLDSMYRTMLDTKGLILDLRGHTIDNFTDQLIAYFSNEQHVFAQSTYPDISYPGRFILSKDRKCGKKHPGEIYSGKVIVLINSGTMSASEYLCMALKCVPNVTFIGSQTAGADGNIVRMSFLENQLTKFTGKGIYYPDGMETQRIGIVPDIVVEPTVKSVSEGSDPQLEKAIEFLSN